MEKNLSIVNFHDGKLSRTDTNRGAGIRIYYMYTFLGLRLFSFDKLPSASSMFYYEHPSNEVEHART